MGSQPKAYELSGAMLAHRIKARRGRLWFALASRVVVEIGVAWKGFY